MSPRFLLAALLLVLCITSGSIPALAQSDTAATLETARTQIDAIQKKLGPELPDAELVAMRATALALQPAIDKALVELAPQLTNVEARLAELGPKPAAGDEAPGIAEQRASLDQARNTIDAQIKLARLLAVESEQTVDTVSNLRRSLFQARIGERTASLLAGPFWTELHAGVIRDGSRARQLADEFIAAALTTPKAVWAALVLAVVALAGLRFWFGQRLLRFTASRVPAGRLRRSVLALATTLLAVAVPTAAAQALRVGLGWQVEPSARLDSLLVSMVGIVSFGAFVAGLGQALLSARRPSWRLPPVPDLVAQHLRHYPLALAIAIVVSGLLDRTAGLVQSNLATAVAINCLAALGLGGVLALGFRRGLRLHRQSLLESGADPHASRGWPSLLIAAGALVLFVSLVCLVIGYVALGSLLVKQLVWLFTIAAAVYLLNAVIDDAFMSLVRAPSSDDDDPDRPQRWRDQTAVLLSGLLRLCLLLVSLVIIAAPFGQGPAELFERAGRFSNDGLVVGEIAVRPAAVLKAVLVFAVAVFCSRLLQRWLADRLLPTTQLDPGMRSSATTLLGYAGIVFAAALALSAVGLGLERVAWVASALSVGIGFGLQAVVSNFVSGLILLAERPVKVGDWVSLGGVEGDIRRINVRATEIQMGDRSTVIVPNSEFITKIVRNVTHANPQGLVQIKLPMPLDADVERVRELMLAAFAAHTDVLDTPGPSVFLDGIEAGHLVFNANGTVNSPRKAYGVKSELLFDILARLREAGVPMARSPTMVLREGPSSGSVPTAMPGPLQNP